ncbi:MAG TPA: hypothetical protein VFN71_10125 [Methylomirabilota bacterium]|nr:hypothetical protein [Methylomirabilota bacterium]
MLKPWRARGLVLCAAALAPVLIAVSPAPAQSPRAPGPQSLPKSSDAPPPRPASRLERLAADTAAALSKYRATLDPVLAIYERELERQQGLAELRQDLYERGALSEHDFQQGHRALMAAQKNVEETRRAMAQADRMLAEVWIAERVARLTPLPRGGYEESADLVRYNGPAVWSLKQGVVKLKEFFTARFGQALPISAFGQTALHDRMGFDHRNALDVAVHPDSPEGRALMDYLRASGIPFIASWGAIPGSSSGAHIHVGQPSPRLVGRR